MAQGEASRYFIGWDVGGWNCDKNTSSRDALVILDADRAIFGRPWRGNLRRHINSAADTTEWLRALFSLCKASYPSGAHCTLAIDTPLGFPQAFTDLIVQRSATDHIPDQSGANPYLFRKTERWLFERGIAPLSAVKDMIGSQATKGLHVLAKFAPVRERCGVWHGGDLLTAIEAYPAPCRRSARIAELTEPYAITEAPDGKRTGACGLDHTDKVDALTCALIAHLFATDRPSLTPPPDAVPASEGWIWLPQDALPA